MAVLVILYAPTVVPTAIPTTVPTAEPTPHVTLAPLSDELEYRVNVTGDKVNVRSSPSRDGKLLKTTSSGNSFVLIDQPEYDHDGVAWYNIRNSSGETGWISSQFCEIVISPKATEIPYDYGDDPSVFFNGDDDEGFDFGEAFGDDTNFDDGDSEYVSEEYDISSADSAGLMHIANCDSWVSLRSKPSTKASRVAKVPLGAEVDVYYYNEKFCWCIYGNKSGFILSKYLE